MKKTRRTTQIGDVVRAEISEIIRRELDDASLMMVTITGVDMTSDLKLARVYVSTLGGEKEIDEVTKTLRKASSRIRYFLGRSAGLRSTPELDFRADTTAVSAGSIEKILKDVLPARDNEAKDESNDD